MFTKKTKQKPKADHVVQSVSHAEGKPMALEWLWRRAHKLSSCLSTPTAQSGPDHISYLSSISSLCSSHPGLFAVPSISEGRLFLWIFLLAIFQAATFFPLVCTSDSLSCFSYLFKY